MPLAALLEPLAVGVLVVLEPHPANAMAATEATATIFIDDLNALSLKSNHIRGTPKRRTFATVPPAHRLCLAGIATVSGPLFATLRVTFQGTVSAWP